MSKHINLRFLAARHGFNDLVKEMGRTRAMRWFRRNLESGQWPDLLQQRAELLARINAAAEDGKICAVESSIDCDGVHSIGGTILPAAVMPFVAFKEGAEYNAEGPCSVGILPPSEKPDYSTRDLALEAFEDGHSHSLYI